MAELRPIIVFHGRHFVRQLEFCNPICVKLLQIMSGVIPRNLKNVVSISNRLPGVHKRGIQTHTHTTIAIGKCNELYFAKKCNKIRVFIFYILHQMAPLKVVLHDLDLHFEGEKVQWHLRNDRDIPKIFDTEVDIGHHMAPLRTL